MELLSFFLPLLLSLFTAAVGAVVAVVWGCWVGAAIAIAAVVVVVCTSLVLIVVLDFGVGVELFAFSPHADVCRHVICVRGATIQVWAVSTSKRVRSFDLQNKAASILSLVINPANAFQVCMLS